MRNKQALCADCTLPLTKVLYMGFPMYMCTSSAHSEVQISGFWSWVPTIWFNGTFLVYKGSYWRALLFFSSGSEKE